MNSFRLTFRRKGTCILWSKKEVSVASNHSCGVYNIYICTAKVQKSDAAVMVVVQNVLIKMHDPSSQNNIEKRQ